MKLVDRVHGSHVHTRRVRVLAQHLSGLMPRNATVLDVGCGDGLLAHLVSRTRPDLQLHGIDVLVRSGTHIPVESFDGSLIPYAAESFETIMFVDVLHHTDDPMVLLKEARRVARKAVIIKDHLCDAFCANATLRFMDTISNARYGVALPFNYWTRAKWQAAINELGFATAVWKTELRLYPRPADWIFGRSLHFIARLEIA